MKITIHQPDFMPWFGFFRKISKADTWIVLDHVENNPRDAAFWGRRVKILVNGNPTWLSIPLCKPSSKGTVGMPIREMRISHSDPKTLIKLSRTLHISYAAAPFYEQFKYLYECYCSETTDSLIVRNMNFITRVMGEVGVETKVLFSSQMNPNGTSNALLVDLLTKAGADTYLCGTGADSYQINDYFQKQQIRVERNEFEHPKYTQLRTKEFVPGLSILDMLFMCGREQTRNYLLA